jgi:hypothetical protein
MLVGKCSNRPVKLFSGYESIQYAPPAIVLPPIPATNIAGDFVCTDCSAINGTNINNTTFDGGDKLFHVFWTGVKYTATDSVDLIDAYYHYDQPAFFNMG